MKSIRNKTIDFTLKDGKCYFDRCIDGEKEKNIPLNSIINGDTFSVLKKIPEKCIDLAIVDPPYNLNKNYHGNNFNKMNNDDYASYTEKWILELKSKLKDTASIYVCCDWKSSIIIAPILEKHFILQNRISWEREKGRGAKSNWKNSMEDIFFATVSDKYTFNLNEVKIKRKVIAPYKENGKPKDWQEDNGIKTRLTCPSNIWTDIAVPYWSMAENTSHPTQKPEKLIAKLILASSNKGDVVLDPFSGSGTTGVVCKKLSRNYYCIEQNSLYCAWAEKRLEDAEKDSSIQGYKNGFFLDRNLK